MFDKDFLLYLGFRHVQNAIILVKFLRVMSQSDSNMQFKSFITNEKNETKDAVVFAGAFTVFSVAAAAAAAAAVFLT